MNKMYEAPKAEAIELNVNSNFMNFIGTSQEDSSEISIS